MGRSNTSRLSLNKETMRNLTERNLEAVVGGLVPGTGTCAGSGCESCASLHGCHTKKAGSCAAVINVAAVPNVAVAGSAGSIVGF
ncbi:MAG: hypothetical protein HJJLKODD_01498 [Phycisphaerae bacterium]|nr:hypothetical protein [Phycisphaerae bacterium]